MAKPKTLTQQYNTLRRKAEKALALPENAGLGLKLPKRPKKITRKSVARMENFNASVKQKNFLRSLRRQERRKISRQNYWERLRQDPQKYEEVKRRRSEGMKRYWEDLKRNKPEEYAERLAKMQRGAAEYRRKVKSGEIEKKTTRIEKEETPRTTKQREAQKKYWEELKRNDPEKYRERIEKLQEGRRKSTQKTAEEIVKEIAEEDIPQIETPEVEEIIPPTVDETAPTTELQLPPDLPQDVVDNIKEYIDNRIREEKEDIERIKPRVDDLTPDDLTPNETMEQIISEAYPELSDIDEKFDRDYVDDMMTTRVIFDSYYNIMNSFKPGTPGVEFMDWFMNNMRETFGAKATADILLKASQEGIIHPENRNDWYEAEKICNTMITSLMYWIQDNPEYEDVMMSEDWVEEFSYMMKDMASYFDSESFVGDYDL